MVAIPVAPQVLIWARGERGLTLESAAAKLNIEISELEAIEAGTHPVNIGVLEHIAAKYKIPLVSLLMPEPPTAIRRPLQDFRAFDGRPAKKLSPETLLAIDDACTFLEMLADLKDADAYSFGTCLVPPYRITDNPSVIANRERQRLKVNISDQLNWNGNRDAFLRWRELVETQGIFTYQMKFGADDTRGVSIWDESEIPLIIISSSENSYQARSFTLWHEYAHIILRMGGISNQNRRNDVERFCNSFAAHFIMPMDSFLIQAQKLGPKHGDWTDWHVARLSNLFKVSKSAVALHLEEANMVSSGFYMQMKALWAVRNPPSPGGRAAYHEKIANRLGGKHVLTVLSALKDGVLNRLDAREFLEVKPARFKSIEKEAIYRRVTYGRP